MGQSFRKFDFGRELLKVIAIVTMALDHIYFILYPDMIILHIIGRLAFPIFAYLIVLGVESTKKPRKYMLTLLSFTLISQVPYFLAFAIQPFERLNILFMFIVWLRKMKLKKIFGLTVLSSLYSFLPGVLRLKPKKLSLN